MLEILKALAKWLSPLFKFLGAISLAISITLVSIFTIELSFNFYFNFQKDASAKSAQVSNDISRASVKDAFVRSTLPAPFEVMFLHYNSFLDAINYLDITYVKHSTETLINYERGGLDGTNGTLNFDFKEMRIDLSTVKYYNEGQSRRVSFRAYFGYNYRERDNPAAAWVPGGNIQNCELVYVECTGLWLADKLEFLKDERRFPTGNIEVILYEDIFPYI